MPTAPGGDPVTGIRNKQYDNTTATISTTEHQSGSGSAQYHWTTGATTPVNGSAQRHKFTASNFLSLTLFVLDKPDAAL